MHEIIREVVAKEKDVHIARVKMLEAIDKYVDISKEVIYKVGE